MLVRLFLTAVLAAVLASAQRGGGGEMGGEGGGMGGSGRGDGGMGGGMPGGIRHLTKEELLLDKLKLNKDQKEEAMKILSAAREKATPVREQMMKGRQIIVSAMVEKREDDVKKMVPQYAMIASEMTGIETEAFGKIYALLKPNQQSKAPQTFELMAGMFAGGEMLGGANGAGRGKGQGRN